MKNFSLQVMAADKSIFSGNVVSLVAPAADGEIGILADHASLVTSLAAGEIRYRVAEDGEEIKLPASAGLLVVHGNKASVLLGG